jgi:RNA polymerase subunit RPABC4/transcription elongation factor Spt4
MPAANVILVYAGGDMFFIFGISQGEKQLKFRQVGVCPACGRYGSVSVWMTYTYFMFFFIPLFKWNRHYYIRMNCCGSLCEIDPRLAHAVECGTVSALDINSFDFTHTAHPVHFCRYCGYTTSENFQYCPKCGKPFES